MAGTCKESTFSFLPVEPLKVHKPHITYCTLILYIKYYDVLQTTKKKLLKNTHTHTHTHTHTPPFVESILLIAHHFSLHQLSTADKIFFLSAMYC